MQWEDRGVVLGGRVYGETSVIVELLTAQHGRHLGVVRGGRSRRLRPVLQPGNSVTATWRARIDDHMGTYTVEGLTLRAAQVIGDAVALHALNHLCGLARLLPERDPHPVLHGMLDSMMDTVGVRQVLALQIVQFELSLLAELGFGLDLGSCAATQSREDLHYVSPRTGRAVSSMAGAPYRDRMLVLPAFLRPDASDARVTREDLAAAFRLTEHFMLRDIFAPRNLAPPAARRAYLALMLTDP